MIQTKQNGHEAIESEAPQTTSVKPPFFLGKSLPDIQEFNINLSHADTNDTKLLVCFFDMNQRPSRHCIIQLTKQARELKEKGITIIAVQALKVYEYTLDEWIKDNKIPFPVGTIKDNENKTRITWGIKSLPWLILTNKQHIVTAEGFTIDELDSKIDSISEN